MTDRDGGGLLDHVRLGSGVDMDGLQDTRGDGPSGAGASDFELLRGWQSGNQASGDELIRLHFWRIYRFFRAKVDETAEDLTQQTFLACVEARDRVDASLSFRAYLFGIARHQLTQYLRRHTRTRARFEPSRDSVAEATGPIDVKIGRAQEQRALLVALRRIPLDHQITIELFYWEELSVAEVAAVLGIAPGTVKSRLGRARVELRRQLGRNRIQREANEQQFGNGRSWADALRGLVRR